MAFKWDKLLSSERQRPTDRHKEDKRSEFERDYDRLVTSSALRRLQDKTQVFPLEHHDFIRTRLTHSLEVSAYGRSFGAEVARRIAKSRFDDLATPERDIPTVMSTVCLAHDIGNPPFGHFGETAIRSWFESWFKKSEENRSGLSDSQQNDFLNFEGNAQGLRILSYLQCLNDDKGLNFTYGTLGSSLKYTASSLEIDKNRKSKQKVGYFTSEKELFEKIQNATGLGNARHPLAFLMEASDDIAYSTTDLEDALKKRVVEFDTIVEALETNLKGTSHFDLLEDRRENIQKEDRKGLKDIYMHRKDEGWSTREAAQIAFVNFRVAAIGAMFRSCVNSFIENYEAIMEGEFDKELITISDSSKLCSALKDIVDKYVYSSHSVLMVEVIGNQVIHSLLDMFVKAVTSDSREDIRTLDGKLFNLVSGGCK
jgi:dGTPase